MVGFPILEAVDPGSARRFGHVAATSAGSDVAKFASLRCLWPGEGGAFWDNFWNFVGEFD